MSGVTSDTIHIGELMKSTGVSFGTSGIRGLVTQMSDRVCYAYCSAFIQHLERVGDLHPGGSIAIAGDFRDSTPRIKRAAAAAASDRGHTPIDCGCIPTPALAYFGFHRSNPSIMVTGSHIPEDRNGLKFNTSKREILKPDEQQIAAATVHLPLDRFDTTGNLLRRAPLASADRAALSLYIDRYVNFLPRDALSGLRIALYEHSTVAHEAMYEVLCALGASVTPIGRADSFVAVDTEAIRQEDADLARELAKSESFDAIVSADGDGDRPLIADERGRWLRGDIVGVLCAAFIGADTIVIPVSCNTVAEKCGYFKKVLRTRIGSPYVIDAMNTAASSSETVIGYEANGGILLGSDVRRYGRRLRALPTRDAMILIVSVLAMSASRRTSISSLVDGLPSRFTASGRIKEFDPERSRTLLSALRAEPMLAPDLLGLPLGTPIAVDFTDGVRLTFTTGDIVHFRSSGNAPEMRCYTEAESNERAYALNVSCLKAIESWNA